MRAETFFIKQGYVSNDIARTLDVDASSDLYWTPQRIRTSASYQYHVYRLAADMVRRHRYKVGMDLGSGPGTKSALCLKDRLERVILIDQPSVARIAKETFPEGEFHAMDLETCENVLGEEVDILVCADVLEHLHDPYPCIRFAHGHLKHGGMAIFSTPERDILRGKDCLHSPHMAHVREWNSAEFKALLEHGGFQVVSQLTCPAKRMGRLEEWLWKVFRSVFNPQKWNACQVAVCMKQADQPR